MGRVSRTLQGTARAAAAKGWYQTIEFAARQAARALVLAVPGGLRLLLDRVGQLGRACGLADAPQFDNAHGSPENKKQPNKNVVRVPHRIMRPACVQRRMGNLATSGRSDAVVAYRQSMQWDGGESSRHCH